MFIHLSVRADTSDPSIVKKELQQLLSGSPAIRRICDESRGRCRLRQLQAAIDKRFDEVNDAAQPQQRNCFFAGGGMR